MKKIFLFAAAVVAAMTINAKVYDFATITADDVQTSLDIVVEEKEGEATGKLLIAVPADMSVVEITLFEDIVLHYNSDAVKNIVIDTKNGYFEFPGNGKTAEGKALVTVKYAGSGSNIVFELANKGSGEVSAVAIDGCTGADVALPAKNKGAEGADANGYIWVEAAYTATAVDATVSTPGARVRKITVESTEGVENVNAAVKAVKTFENGQLVIIKNGVKYNALGVQL